MLGQRQTQDKNPMSTGLEKAEMEKEEEKARKLVELHLFTPNR